MSTSIAFQKELVSIFESLANAAVTEIIKLVDSSASVLRQENAALKRSLVLMERELEAAQGGGSITSQESSFNISVQLQVRDESVEDERGHDNCYTEQRPTAEQQLNIDCAVMGSESSTPQAVAVKNESADVESFPLKMEAAVEEDPEGSRHSSTDGDPSGPASEQEGLTPWSEQAGARAVTRRPVRPRKQRGGGLALGARIKVVPLRGRRCQRARRQEEEEESSSPASAQPELPTPVNRGGAEESEWPSVSLGESPEWNSEDGGSVGPPSHAPPVVQQAVEPQGPEPPQKHTCSYCWASFTDPVKHKIHELHHCPFTCTLCSQTFGSAERFREHLQTHARDKPRFKPFRCDQCGKSFTAKSSLKTHQVTHTGERPFCCRLCGRRFGLLCNLKTHERLHSGERPFHCARCGKNFTQKHVLKKHVCAVRTLAPVGDVKF